MKTNCIPSTNQPLVKALICVFLVLLCCSIAYGQNQNNTPQRGFHPAGSYALTDLEDINTVNGNMMFRVPLTGLPHGRGNSPGASLGLIYNSKLYDTQADSEMEPGGSDLLPISILRASDEGGWRYGFHYQLKLEHKDEHFPNVPVCNPGQAPGDKIYKLKMSFPDGSVREFHPLGYTGDPGSFYAIRPDGWVASCNSLPGYWTYNPISYYTTDGTYLRLVVDHDDETGNWSNNPWTLYFPDGTRITFNEPGSAGQRFYDRNNNFTEVRSIYYNGHPAHQIIDQLNRSIIIEYDTAIGRDYVYSPGVNNAQLQWTINWTFTYVLKGYYADEFSGMAFPKEVNVGFYVVSQIILPPQAGTLSYTFTYSGSPTYPYPIHTNGYGELSSVTLPSGAQATYQYFYNIHDYLNWNRVLDNHPSSRNLTWQREYDCAPSCPSDPATETWQYSPVTTANCPGQACAKLIKPDGGTLTEYITNTGAWDGKLVYKTEHPDGSVMERIWQQNVPYGLTVLTSSVEANVYVKTEFTSVKDANGTLVKTAIKDYNQDKNGNVTQVKEYDWVAYSSVPRDVSGKPTGIPAGAVLKRVKVNTYYSPTPDASDTTTDDPDVYHKTTSPRLRNAIESSEVRSGTSVSSVLSRNEYFYDNFSTTGNLITEKSWDSTKGAIMRPLTSGNSISVTHQYDGVYGNRRFTTDARGYQSEFVYDANNLYVIQTKVALGTSVQRRTDRAYDFSTGVVTSETDFDNNVTSQMTYDAFGRPTIVKEAVGTPNEKWMRTEYNDQARRVVVRAALSATDDQKLVTVQHYDQLGRIRLSRQLENPNDDVTNETLGIKVQTRYFAGDLTYPNSYQVVSNPYRAATSSAAGSEGTMGWTRTKLDEGGRVIEVETFNATLPQPWGAGAGSTGTLVTGYDAEFTTVTDQAGKVRRSMIDGLGRLARVDEPGGSGGLGDKTSPNQPTSYTYNALNNLTQVNQGAQTRTFVYSSLSRLISATNPESGPVTYVYDNNGNLTSKTDARPVTTTITYDALNRPTTKTYSCTTPAVSYVYDNQPLPSGAPSSFNRGSAVGQLVAVNYGSNSSAGSYYGYDELGRVVRKTQQINGNNYAVTASYNLASAMIGEIYPSGRAVTYSYDIAGRLSSFTGNLGDSVSRNYATGITYTSAGLMTQEKFQAGTANQLYHNLHYNNRLQLYDARLGTGTGDGQAAEWTWNRGALLMYYDSNYAYGDGGLNNNGNVYRMDHFIPLNDSVSQWAITEDYYGYDALNRLASFTDLSGGATSASQNFNYDRYGNRWVTSATGGVSSYWPSYSASNNRISNLTYDAAGNITSDPATGGTMIYDGENRLVMATSGGGGSYTYDGEGKRVKRMLAGGQEWWYVYGIGGELLAEYLSTAPTTVKKEYGYRDGQLLVVWNGDESTADKKLKWLVQDHLGSTRMEADKSGSLVGMTRHDYAPFGEELFAGIRKGAQGQPQYGYTASNVRQKFDAYERDNETGLDYAQARYYANIQGRFTSPDEFNGGPEEVFGPGRSSDEKQALPYADIFNPQSLNKYQHCLNNPLRYIDPEGHQTSDLENIRKGLKALELSKKALERLGKSGSLVSAATEIALEGVFGPKIYFSRGGLDKAESAFAAEVAVYSGRSFMGVASRDAPGIDGVSFGLLTTNGVFKDIQLTGHWRKQAAQHCGFSGLFRV